MPEILELIKNRQSTRAPFNGEKSVSRQDMEQILEAARWAPTAHNMQNFEIVVVDGKKTLEAISAIRSPLSKTFVQENYQQLSFSEEELLKKKVGLLGTMFPPALRNPEVQPDRDTLDRMASFQSGLIKTASALLIVVYDPGKRAPASEGDFLGIVSLGCMMENMWLTAEALGIGCHIVSAISSHPAESEIKKLLNIPQNLMIAFSIRLGYPAAPVRYLRVRRDIKDFTHHNRFDNQGLD